jgi:DegV family protein with EDD domain
MPKVAILSDSTAALPAPAIQGLPVFSLPLKLIWQGKTYRDGIDISAGEFYRQFAQSNEIATTSQLTTEEYVHEVRRLLAEGWQLLLLPISSGVSGSYFQAEKAMESFKGAPVALMDTKLVSMPLGFMVLAAARAAQAGESLAECQRVAEQAFGHIGVYFTVETLKYLHRGGRIGSAKRWLGTALAIKPILSLLDGKIEAVESVMTRRKSLERILDLVEEGIAGRQPVRYSVFHAGAEEAAQSLEERARARFNAVESIPSQVSPAVGAHTGPGTVAIAYMAGM